MLSRSNSNAGDRIRRAKSTSSTHTAASGIRPVYPQSDPFVTRQQAETAALEAYYRAQQPSAPACQEYGAVPRPKLERKRSRASGRTEGGHLEEARLGRKKSTSKRDEKVASKPVPARPLQHSETTNESNDDERVIVRKRSVIPPNSSSTYNYSLPSSSSRHVRRSQPEYVDGSPMPRNSSALKDRRSAMQLKNATNEHAVAHRNDYNGRPYGIGQDSVPTPTVQTPRGTVPDTQTDEEVIALARDRCLQDFQQKKLRERKSFILGPFQKRKSSTHEKSSSSGYDTSLPPFNYADESILPPPPPPPPELPISAVTVQPERKPRNFSESLKGRFKKVFRRTSRIPTELPAQHVEGKHFYLGTNSPLSTPGVNNEKEGDPFATNSCDSYLSVPEPKPDSASRKYSVAGQSTTNSRFTSWTNSTTAGTWSTRPDEEPTDSADECGRLKRSDSVSTLRKATSFLGRPIRNKLRKQSRAELRSSEETANLYTALQERINPSESTSQTPNDEQPADSRTSSDLATLPSQQRAGSSISNTGNWQAPTIRSVTPDALGSRSDPLSPVTEVLSPDTTLQPSTIRSRANDEQSDSTPRSQLQRRPAIKAPTPSKEQIARRIERSKNRWQSALDELSPPAPRATSGAMEDNPYELPSLSRTLHQPVPSSDLPHHAKVSEHPTEERETGLSPSLYSRGTDGISPRPETPMEAGGTMITITGHEVRSYSISPKKLGAPTAHAMRPSHEWRRWLSNELSGWNSITAPQALVLPQATPNDTQPHAAGVTEASQQRDAEDVEGRAGCESPAPEATPLETKTHRRKAKSRRPSTMNDRYPMLDTGRNLSDKTIKRASRISSQAASRPVSIDPSSGSSTARKSEAEAGSSRATSVMTTGKLVSKHLSTGQLKSTARRSTTSALTTREDTTTEEDTCSTNKVPPNANDKAQPPSDPATKASSKSKSAFDLRANYKTSAGGWTKPLPVRRKPDTNQNILIWEDNTIQNISAGPYASQVPISIPPAANKENTPPSEANGLPALSSSEWLAAGTNKNRDAKKASAGQPTNNSRSVSRYSPSRAATSGSPVGGGNSPGQQLVTNWLDGKRSKENSPAFV